MDYLVPYPFGAGYKKCGTSEEAAGKVDSSYLRLKVLGVLMACPAGLTADEAAGKLGQSVLSIRPRFSELLAMGKIKDTGLKRQNDSRRRAIVWTVCE